MKQQLTKTLILCLLISLSHEKKKKKDDGDLQCYNQYCEDGDVKVECRSKGDIRRCTNRKNMGLKCEDKTGQSVTADLVCKSDFINTCECGYVDDYYVNKTTKENVKLKKSKTVCDCSMKSSAKVMIAMVVSFTIALAGCGYCFARWYVVKKETVRLELEKRGNDYESKFETYGDYSNQSGGQRYSAATQSAGLRTGGGSGGQGCRTGRSPMPSPITSHKSISPAADKRGPPATSESGKTSSSLAPAAAEERWRSVSPHSPAVQAWPVASNPAAVHLRARSPNPGARARSRSPNPAAGRGRPVSPRPHTAAAHGRPVSPNPATGRGCGRPVLNTTAAPKITSI